MGSNPDNNVFEIDNEIRLADIFANMLGIVPLIEVFDISKTLTAEIYARELGSDPFNKAFAVTLNPVMYVSVDIKSGRVPLRLFCARFIERTC
jgi:hypothetical protein